ncbi:MAG TPA: hypothetical protein VN697_06265 [Tepidiformaceae bacterium]|jgi:hypothetical protein|nr:hypothetical protein [Tepidiformaceae bacterium]
MTTAHSSSITVEDGVIAGPLRSSVNNSITVKGSIHDDATATKLGFRGGTVAGSIHMELFPPLLLEAFGPHWFERGTLSMYFRNATTDREPVRASMRQPSKKDDTQVEVWVDREDGMRVAEGTASVGSSSEPTALLARPLDRFEPGELRMLQGIDAGYEFPRVDVRLDPEAQDKRMQVITEKLDWYEGKSPWGGPIATPAAMVQLLYAKSVAQMRGNLGKAVGLFGAIELRNVNGPVFVDEPYEVTGHVVAVGQSPKTEYMWFETGMDDTSGKRVAEMRMLLRWMKASSPLYAE